MVRLCPCWEVVPEVLGCSERHHGLVPEVSYYCVGLLALWQGLRTQQHGLKQRPRAPCCAQSSRAPGAGRLLLSNCSMEPSEGAALLSASRMVPVATPLPVPGALVPELEFSPCPTDPEPKQSGPVLSSMWAGMVWGLCLAFGGSCRPPPMKEKADFTF